jgi:hypothetical protein
MSRGPGRIERAIRQIFDAHPDQAWPTEVLASWCFGEPTERWHRVSVLRAAHKLVAADPHWATWRMRDIRQCVFVNEASALCRETAKGFMCCPGRRVPRQQHISRTSRSGTP